jgi:hypothetical protein
MESNQSLFSLTIDPITKAHLLETAKWGRFLAILGIISLVLLLLICTVGISLMPDTPYSDISGFSSGAFRVGIAFYVIVISVIWFFPLLILLRFSNGMRTALYGNDQNLLNGSFQNLKRLFRFVGIVTIIVLALYVLVIVMIAISAGTMSR